MSKHTPAPWTQAELAQTEIVANGDTMIATAREGLNGITREQAIANAKLITAAPELLAHLESLVAYMGQFSHSNVGHNKVALARAAIAKAGGVL